MHHFARNRDCALRVPPFDGPAVFLAHTLQQHSGLGASVLAIHEIPVAGSAERFDEAGIHLGDLADVFVVFVWQAGRVVEPGPHDGSGAEGEEEGVGLGG